MTKQDEQIIDTFLQDPPMQSAPATQSAIPTDEQLVEKKARQLPTKTTVLQNKTRLAADKLENRIDEILAKNAGKINESDLREAVGERLEQNGRITEADLVQIQDQLLQKYDAAQEKKSSILPAVNVPPALTNAGQAVGNQASMLADWASSLKTPGGIGILLAVLFIMMWVLIPTANGQTRMSLIWGTLTGQVQFDQAAIQAENAEDYTTSSGAYSNVSGGKSTATTNSTVPTTTGNSGTSLLTFED